MFLLNDWYVHSGFMYRFYSYSIVFGHFGSYAAFETQLSFNVVGLRIRHPLSSACAR